MGEAKPKARPAPSSTHCLCHCPFCRPFPAREHGDSSGRVFDDMKIGVVVQARNLVLRLIEKEIADRKLDEHRQRSRDIASAYEPMPVNYDAQFALATAGSQAAGELRELEDMARYLRREG